MASFLYRTRGMVQVPRYLPTFMSRAQASQGAAQPSSTSSVLPKSTTSSDKTNPMKTSSDAPPLDHENIDIKNKPAGKQSQTTSSSSSSSSGQQSSFLNSPAGKIGALVALTVGIYAGYQMIGSGSGGKDSKKSEHYKRATADYQPSNTQGTDVKK